MTDTGINNNKIDRERLGDRFYRYEISRKLGLIQVYAYHCARCNYTWLPKGFDGSRTLDGWGNTDLFLKEPPSSCARCKSKYWRKEYMQRKNKAVVTNSYGRIIEPTSKTRVKFLTRSKSMKDVFDTLQNKPELINSFIKLLNERYPAAAVAKVQEILEEIRPKTG